MKKNELTVLVEKLGQRYSEFLGINVDSGKDGEIFKWFLVAVLFGAPINESSVLKTYKAFEKHDMLNPKKIVETGWEGLVKILDEGSYTRYDYKTADKLLLVMGNLNGKYNGSLNRLHHESYNSSDLERRLKELGKGIGNVTVSIFLRELRGVWSKADPKPTPLVISAAEKLGIAKDESPEKALSQLKNFWKQKGIKSQTFINFETALMRWSRENKRKRAES